MAQSLVVIAAVSGLALVSLSSGNSEKGSGAVLFGLLMATASGVLYAVVTVLSQKMAREVAPLALTTATTTIGAGILVPLAVLAGPVLTADFFSLLALVYLGAVTMAVGYLLLFAGLSTASASAAAVATLIEPVTATALAVVLLGDRLTALAITGIVLILASVAMLQVGQQPTGARSRRTSVGEKTQDVTGPEHDGLTSDELA
jgi:DME family drug/metabolite transporter